MPEHIGHHCGTRQTVRVLAAIAGPSSCSFESNFSGTFNITPIRDINRVRLQAARYRLVRTNQLLASIAAECGFYDQIHMTAMFTRHFGLSPHHCRDLQA